MTNPQGRSVHARAGVRRADSDAVDGGLGERALDLDALDVREHGRVLADRPALQAHQLARGEVQHLRTTARPLSWMVTVAPEGRWVSA